MKRYKVFNLARLRLAGLYAGVMGIILSVSGASLYRATAHAHWTALDRELESVAGTLHDSFETSLQQPGRLEDVSHELLRDICLTETGCFRANSGSIPHHSNSPSSLNPASGQPIAPTQERHVLGAIHRNDYYIRLLDQTGQLQAIAGSQSQQLPVVLGEDPWQTLATPEGHRYHQLTLPLHTQDNRSWGYLQVGRSLKDLDDHLAALQWVLLLGLPVSLLLVGGSSWWLAGLAMRPVYQSYQQMEQFTADVAHELRTPIAGVKATVASAVGIPPLANPEGQLILQEIEDQTNRLAQVVQDLLLLSRTERQAVVAQQQPCCLNDIVIDSVEELAPLAIAANVQLTHKICTPKPLYVNGHDEQLYRLVANLITNAIHYTSAGGEVIITLTSTSQQALIQVQDNGVGIAATEQARIFERFYRVNSDRSRHTGGSGLGLSIAQAIAKAHKGTLQVQSELGHGSTFTIQLPLDRTTIRLDSPSEWRL